MQPLYWIILFIVLLVIEIFTMGLTTVWFAGGSLVSLIAALLGANEIVQWVLFIVVSTVLVIVTRPLALKYFNIKREPTNAESLIGQTALVIEDIDTLHAVGRVEVNGQEWAAKTESPNGIIQKETVVSIKGIQGVKLIVEPKEG